MSITDVYMAARSYLEGNWDLDTVPIAWENEYFEVPSPGRGIAWVFVALDDSDYEQMSIGTGSPTTELWRETGALLFRVNVPIDTGTLRADQLIAEIRDLMRGLTLPSNIRFMSMPTVGRARSEDGNWFSVWVRVIWESD